MPSASATAMPLVTSTAPCGMQTPWKSWLRSLRPAAECWPTRTASPLLMFDPQRGPDASGDRGGRGRFDTAWRGSVEAALGGRAHVRGVQRKAGEGEAADEVAEHDRDLVPDEVVEDREVTAHHQPGGKQEHVHHRVLEG